MVTKIPVTGHHQHQCHHPHPPVSPPSPLGSLPCVALDTIAVLGHCCRCLELLPSASPLPSPPWVTAAIAPRVTIAILCQMPLPLSRVPPLWLPSLPHIAPIAPIAIMLTPSHCPQHRCHLRSLPLPPQLLPSASSPPSLPWVATAVSPHVSIMLDATTTVLSPPHHSCGRPLMSHPSPLCSSPYITLNTIAVSELGLHHQHLESLPLLPS